MSDPVVNMVVAIVAVTLLLCIAVAAIALTIRFVAHILGDIIWGRK